MSEPDQGESDGGRMDKPAHWLWRRADKWYLLWLPPGAIFSFFAGIILWGGFNTAVELSSTETFCISCHSMRDNVYQEYQETIHYKNTSGVRATCPDCHVPTPWVYKILRKFRATYTDIPAELLGTINTREKFEARRAVMAEDVWQEMKAADSRECRNCHAMEFMDLQEQDPSARKKHYLNAVRESGKTCIDCHQGIAHHLPEVE